MYRTRGSDKGWGYRQVNSSGQETGKLIQYHPGTHRHFNGAPYWMVSDGTNVFYYVAKRSLLRIKKRIKLLKCYKT